VNVKAQTAIKNPTLRAIRKGFMFVLLN
jgi:hypothetical protein